MTKKKILSALFILFCAIATLGYFCIFAFIAAEYLPTVVEKSDLENCTYLFLIIGALLYAVLIMILDESKDYIRKNLSKSFISRAQVQLK